MRTFDEVRRDLNLEKGVGSANGDLYVVPVAPGAPRLLVRHFNRDLPSRLVPAYASLLREAQAWIDRDPELARVVRVDQPTEVGEDFLARPHRLGTPLSAYTDDEDPPDPPDELHAMQKLFRVQVANVSGPRDELLGRILARSILEPSGWTLYSFPEQRFIVTDLEPTREELEQYAQA